MSNNKGDNFSNNLKDMFQKLVGTIDYTNRYKEKEREDNRMMAMLSYVIPIIPFLAERNSAYVRFHSNQGMNLFVWYILVSIFIGIVNKAGNFEFITNFIGKIILLLFIALIAFGIINTLNDRAKELPIVSKINLITIISDFFGK